MAVGIMQGSVFVSCFSQPIVSQKQGATKINAQLQRKMEKTSIVFFPSPGVGHLISAVELAKQLAEHDHRFSITFLLMPSPLPTPATSSYIHTVASSHDDIHFLQLPTLDFSPDPNMCVETMFSLFVQKYKPLVSDSIRTLFPVRALLIDLFATSMLDVAAEFDIPTYLYFTSSAVMLSFMLYMPTLHLKIPSEFKDYDGLVEIPGMSPLPPLAVPTPLLNKKNEGYTWFLHHATRYRETKGLIVNTFEALEPEILKALEEGKCLPDHPTPPIYPVGPLLALNGDTGQNHACIKWLDGHPRSSVLFLCFGSHGSFSVHQVKAIAAGLERSGHRFLWSIRSPSTDHFAPRTDAKLDEVMPEGFLERTRERGMVWPGWAPQVAILSHAAIGGFVSHCGWNSILESLWFGVPIIPWPLYAEQKLNAFELVRDLGLAVELGIDYRGDGFVAAEELERVVRVLMEGEEEGERVRRNAEAMGDKSRQAVKGGGSSCRALARLAKELAHPA